MQKAQDVAPYVAMFLMAEYLIIGVYNMYHYWFKRVRLVENNSFHLFMTGLVIACGFCSVLSECLYFSWCLMHPEIPLDPLKILDMYGPLYKGFVFFFCVEWLFDLIMHCTFAVKYWTAS